MRRRRDTQSHRGRVLVCDDDAATRRLMQISLSKRDFEVVLAENGLACIDKAATYGPDVVLLDINMPGLDGIETCRKLKASPETSDIPVLFVTGQSQHDDKVIVAALDAGGNDFVSKDAPIHVLVARVRSQVAISRAHIKLRRLAMTDDLTGVFSRRFLLDSFRRAVKNTSRGGGPADLSCLLADIDDFKRINDTLGHIQGDAVLRQVAKTIDRVTRETDVVARFGGEEFVVLMPHTDIDGAVVGAEKIRAAVARECEPVTISIGVAALTNEDTADIRKPGGVDLLIQSLLRRADKAMYTAKDLGKNRVEVQR